MPDLIQALQHHDIGYLQIVAGLWGVELRSKDLEEATSELAASLLDPDLAAELTTSLSPEARSALAALAADGGRVPWAAFARQFGQVRDMGTARRDREKPHLNPAAPAEVLFYRALLFRAFFNTDRGPQEFAYIPDDLLKLVGPKEHTRGGLRDSMPPAGPMETEPLGRGATPGERKHIQPVSDRVLDDATTLLAALRLGHDLNPDPKLFALLTAADLISAPRQTGSKASGKVKTGREINAEKAKVFLEAPRPEALRMLTSAWRKSETFNELRLMPGLLFEGEWGNQTLVTRDFLLDLLKGIPDGAWWSLNAFIGAIKKTYPDFQRPAGDYDSWFIKRAADGTYLRGFAYWDQVDGALLRFFITDTFYWLGMLELGSAEESGPITAFHLLEASDDRKSEESGKISVASNGKMTAPRLVPRAVRYQLSRFCEWDEEKPDGYHYHLTPQSLLRAREQGLKVEHLLTLLTKHAAAGVPPVLVKALKRWELNGTEAKAETQVILKVSRPEVLEELRKSKAARFLSEPLGPTTIVIKAGAQPKVMAALAELGLLAEDNTAKASANSDQ